MDPGSAKQRFTLHCIRDDGEGGDVRFLRRFEAGQNINLSSLNAMKEALEGSGIQFIPENGGGPGVRLRAK